MLHEVVQKATECHSFEFSNYLLAKCRTIWLNQLKLRVDFAEGLLVKYSVQHGMSDHQDGAIIKRQMEHQFPRRIAPTEKKRKQQDGVLHAASTTKERVYTTVNTVIVLCASMGVSRLTTQG
jgi:hypothetical protein